MIIGRVISTSEFTYHKGVFVTEITDVINPTRLFERLYNDAADVGFVLQSHKTGRQQAYYLAEETKTENDLVKWTFLPTDRCLPELVNTKVVVYND